jgi:hypothetical protein
MSSIARLCLLAIAVLVSAGSAKKGTGTTGPGEIAQARDACYQIAPDKLHGDVATQLTQRYVIVKDDGPGGEIATDWRNDDLGKHRVVAQVVTTDVNCSRLAFRVEAVTPTGAPRAGNDIENELYLEQRRRLLPGGGGAPETVTKKPASGEQKPAAAPGMFGG